MSLTDTDHAELNLALRVLDVDTVLITYDSIVTTGDGRVQCSQRTYS